MVRARVYLPCCLAVLTLALSGCGEPKKDMGDMQSMEKPKRPEQLDRLEAWVGRWEGTMEMKMAGAPEAMKCTYNDEIAWGCDNHFLIENLTGQMGDDKFVGIGMWGWDARHNNYSNWWFDGSGEAARGWSTYDEADKSWHSESSGHNPMLDKRTYGSGCSRFTDANTIEWNWKEWDNAWKWGDPVMEMSGTSHRK